MRLFMALPTPTVERMLRKKVELVYAGSYLTRVAGRIQTRFWGIYPFDVRVELRLCVARQLVEDVWSYILHGSPPKLPEFLAVGTCPYTQDTKDKWNDWVICTYNDVLSDHPEMVAQVQKQHKKEWNVFQQNVVEWLYHLV